MRIKVQDKVKNVLLTKPNTKDNDFYLMYWIWIDEFGKLKGEHANHNDSFDHVDVTRLLRLLNDKKLTHPSAISRARRKIQEMYPITRGSLWSKRHKHQTKIKKDLGYAMSTSDHEAATHIQCTGDEVI